MSNVKFPFFFRDWSERQKVDHGLSRSREERSKLPIFGMREEILRVIHENQVVLIRGATGDHIYYH